VSYVSPQDVAVLLGRARDAGPFGLSVWPVGAQPPYDIAGLRRRRSGSQQHPSTAISGRTRPHLDRYAAQHPDPL